MPRTYKIKKSDQNYINALTTYFQKGEILAIKDGKSTLDVSEDNLSCKNLPEILKTIKSDEFVITTTDRHSADNVLPPFDSKALRKLSEKEKHNTPYDELNYHKIWQNAALIKQYIKRLNDPNELCGVEAPLLMVPIESASFTKYNALELLDSLNIDSPINSALLLADIETIVFQSGEHFFRLGYGTHAKFDGLNHFMFDVDDGFLCAESWRSDYDEKKVTQDALNVFFNKWKDNHYTGDLIPPFESGFECSPVTTEAKSGLNNLSVFAHQTSSPSAAPQAKESVKFKH